MSKIEYVYASLLLHTIGKEINEENLTAILKAAGVDVDPVRVKSVVAALSKIDIDEAIKSAAPVFAAPAAAPAAAAPAAAPAPAEEKEEKKEEEEKEEETTEEEIAAGLGALFG